MSPGSDGAVRRDPDADVAAVRRLLQVMDRLRTDCPWDREQTHRSLVPYLVEETYEVVEAIETGDAEHLAEELGDLLLQVVFHARISADGPAPFDLAVVADTIADKLVRRHPHVFAGEQAADDLDASWEQRKAVEKGRTSVLQGIPPQLPPLARATKIIGRARARGVAVQLPGSDGYGDRLLALVAEAQASGVDPDQQLRDAVRSLEDAVARAETAQLGSDVGS